MPVKRGGGKPAKKAPYKPQSRPESREHRAPKHDPSLPLQETRLVVMSEPEYHEYLQTENDDDRAFILGKRGYYFGELSPEKQQTVQLDFEAAWSVTEMKLAFKTTAFITEVIKRHDFSFNSNVATITDGTACVGGNALSFSTFFGTVNAVENHEYRVKMLCHNLIQLNNGINRSKYSVQVRFYWKNYVDICHLLKQDIVFLDPPWGGPAYKEQDTVHLFLSGVRLVDVCRSLQGYAKYIALKLPHNFAFEDFYSEGSKGGVLELLDTKEMLVDKGKNRSQVKFVVVLMKVSPLGSSE
jgi:hypothetical protein